MIEIIELKKIMGEQQVLKGVNLKVEEGQTLALIGGSGEGKSVLLKNIIGLLKPDSGSVMINGKNICQSKGKALGELKEKLGIVFQFGALFDSLSLYDNVKFPLKEKTKLSDAQIHDRVMQELSDVGLEKDIDKFPAQISGGMKKRVALARCLVLKPEVIFFDEPTTGLDPIITKSIYKMILHLQETRNLTSLIVSHEIPGIFKVVDRVAMLHDGHIVFSGTPEEIQKSTDPIVQQFLSGEID